MPARRARTALLLVLPLLALVAACGGDDEPEGTTTSSTTTTEAPEEAGGDAGAGGRDPWARNASELRDRVGERFDIECPPGGRLGTVWGSNTYTDDSSICTAAVHVGLITVEEGGEVTIEIAEGAEEYVGSEHHGVTTQDYGPYAGSFTFPDAGSLEVAAAIGWDRAAAFYDGREATTFSVECEGDGEIGAVWGTDVYTADSSICTAALHAGLVTLADGGEVTFELVDGQDEYAGSTANGVTSLDYGSYDRSFRFVD